MEGAADTKRIASAILGHGPPTPPGVGDDEAISSGDEGLEACAADAMAATKSGDGKAFVSAMRSMFELLRSEPDEMEGD